MAHPIGFYGISDCSGLLATQSARSHATIARTEEKPQARAKLGEALMDAFTLPPPLGNVSFPFVVPRKKPIDDVKDAFN